MSSTLIRCLSVVGLLLVPSVTKAQLTIPEMVSAGSTERTTLEGSGAVNVSDVLRETDLIVRAVVGKPRASFLSDDQFFVLTEYPLINAVVLYSSEAIAARKPESSIPVTLRGGTIQINGVLFHDTGIGSLTPGLEGVFLLDHRRDRYWLAGDRLGALALEGGKLVTLGRNSTFETQFRERNGDMLAEEAAADIAARARDLHR